MNYGGRTFAAGGAMPMEQLTEFNEGGRHEENGLGGIPQGMNPDGQMNLVEEGETKFDAENYIYSDSLKVDKELAEAFNLSPKMVGKTFADASKMAGRKKSKREGDAIEEAANEKDLTNLMEAQEAFKQARIEEKLQEIAELDPNALPALMGQGQPQGGPQGDPAMGGQMQEAPMDEQAMMEQQMMAQQGGGGQPSPEEMAMMQQQQNMAMGQQEGMMRAGGPLNPPYGPITEKESELQDDYKRAKKYAYETDLTFNPEKLVRMQPLNWEDVSLEDYRKMVNTPKSKYYSFDRADDFKLAPEAEKLGGYLGDGKGSFSKRSYAPGGFMGTTNTLGDPPPNMATTSRANSVGDGDFTYKFSDNSAKKRNPLNSFYENQGFQKEYIMDPNNPEVTQQVFINPNDPKQSKLTGNRVKMFRMANKGKLPLVQGEYDGSYAMGGNLMQSGQEAGLNPMQGMNQFFNMGGMLSGGLAEQNLNLNQGLASQMRRGGKMCYGCGGAMHNYGGRMNQMATGGEIVAGIGSGLYGIGEGLLDTLTFGLTDELTDKGYEALQEIGPMKGEDNVGDAIRGGANVAGAATGAVLTGGATTGSAVSQGSKGTGDMLGAIGEETGNETLGKIGKGVEGAGQVAGMFIGGGGAGSAAGKAAEGAGTVAAGAGTLGAGAKVAEAAKTAEAASKAAQAAKFAKVGEIASNKGVQAGVNMATQAVGTAADKKEAERLTEAERMRIEREMMMTNDPTSSYYNPTVARYGKKLYKGGGRLYNTGGPLTLKKSITNPDGTTIEQDVTYNSMEELLADTEMVNKYGGKEATRQAFANRFKKSNIPTSISDPIGTIANQVLNPETEENPAMISYINKFKEQEEADRKEEIENTINTMREKSEYMPQVKRMPVLPAGMLTAPQTNQQMVIPDAPIIENEPTLVDPTVVQTSKTQAPPKTGVDGVVDPNKDKDDNEVDVDVDQTDVNRDYTFKESPGQFAAKMAAPMMNLYSGLFDKYDPKFELEFQKTTAPKLDYTESINSIRRNAAKTKRAFKKVGSNPSNMLALSQQTNSLEAQAIQQIDVINAKLEFEAEKLNNAQKQRLEKTKKELQLGFEEAKRKSLQAAAKQFQDIATTNQANELAQQYAAMGAENVGKVEYQTLVEQLGDLLKKRKEKKNKKK